MTAPSPPSATRPGNAHAAPSGVTESVVTASSSWLGTVPPHSSEAKKTPTGTTTTSTTRRNSPDSSRERRSRRNSEVSAMHTRASSTQVATPSSTPTAPANHGAPCSVHTIAVHTASAVSASVGTLMNPATASTAASLPRESPSTAKRRGSSGSSTPPISGREDEPERHGRAAEHGDRQDDLGLGIPQRQQAPADGGGPAGEEQQPEHDARDVPGVAAQRTEEQCDPQSENVCSHSRPSTSLSPPASSMKRCSRVSSPRTSSIVPSASTWPATITATREQTRSTRSMP